MISLEKLKKLKSLNNHFNPFDITEEENESQSKKFTTYY